MNAVEIEEAVSTLAEAPFDADEFPYAFLEAFGNKATTLKKLRSGNTNKSDLPGGVLQRNNIHIQVCPQGEVTAALAALRNSPATASQKAKFILATDGKTFEAENLADGETVACDYADFHDHFGFFLALAGITTVKQIRENAFDIKATGRLNRLYVELLKENPEWDTIARREDLNHFFARLIFCFFAEDTRIFTGGRLFTDTVTQMSASDSSNTHGVLAELFRAMNTPHKDRESAKIKNWANSFPYVNGGLFSGSLDVPRFSRIARSYLLHVGNLDWRQINPDIFGSMIQAVADEEERGALGMHYTSVPNILKVLNPLFLDDLRAKLEEAGDNSRKLLNLRNRIARIRVFDPACGSGNFLVIAYKEMRAIEAEINRRRASLSGGVQPRRPSEASRDESQRASEIPLTNFRGIEIRHFSCEIARLALIIAEYQCDVLYRGEKLALAEFLPLDAANWITCGNALRLDWLEVCPPPSGGVQPRRASDASDVKRGAGGGVKPRRSGENANDLFATPLAQPEIDFEHQEGETYICGNPPYKGSQTQTKAQKADLANVFDPFGISSKQIDYVGGWFLKAAEYGRLCNCRSAFVSTNSICQGRIVPILWPLLYKRGARIFFARTSFKWSNLASHNAGVTVVIVGLAREGMGMRLLFSEDDDGQDSVRAVDNINAYLAAADDIFVEGRRETASGLSHMSFGNMPVDGGNLLLTSQELESLVLDPNASSMIIHRIHGSKEFIRGIVRYCLWIEDSNLALANQYESVRDRIQRVISMRSKSEDGGTKALAAKPHQFREMNTCQQHTLIVPSVSSETREYFPVGILNSRSTVSNLAFALYDAPLWNMALIASRLHLVWIATVCGKLKTDYRYSNTLGWNTFPVPALTDQNQADLTKCAEDILLAREAHFPATIADLYDPEHMPADLRAAHDRNDETLERIYIGRRFKNDTGVEQSGR
jgi:hypothetical protein